MASFTKLLYHCVFSTKDRRPTIGSTLRARLHDYMSGIVRNHDGRLIGIGGTEDHVHMQLHLPPTVCVSDAMRVIKTNSSRWANEKRLTSRPFGWQPGYAAFSVSESNRDAVIEYIAKQHAHHKKVDFKAEFVALLRRHGIAYDEGHLWG